MTTEEQFQSLNIQQSNGPENGDTTQEPDNEVTTITSNTSSGPPLRRSRFFRSKRKQRQQEEQYNQVDTDNVVSNEPINASESSGKKQSTEETPAEEVLVTATSAPIAIKVKRRVFVSPPPSPPSTDDNDETDASTTSEETQFTAPVEDLDAERQAYLTKKHTNDKSSSTQSRLTVQTSFSGYQRKKSQSVKLTNADRVDAYPKKNVRFADDFGLDLSQIKVIKSDELPHVPSAAFKDLHVNYDENSLSFYQERMKLITYLEQQFENPIHTQGFDDRVLRHKVVLEQANAIDNKIYGTVKIISFGYNKRVKIRFTTDNWITFHDHNATYITDSHDGTHDRFTFALDIDRDRICVGNNIQFCVGYETYVGQDYWDSNYEENYRFDCVSRTIPDYSG
ncbi:unnamed protein product [Rotaria sp. Silwood2]|nr:unnamed protein product [Rotaria sp. Silwood2]CAF2645141.1 unnamed protein product [Rotaria sp. Silwood2]CAF2908091.1 unnamed protein product [Rotaria sp. Silwood2]CAF3058951.1 unnamed protein product [Rotaria sp. Silwood2]CAF3891576.1 unnamed protein product [Rotaria sp. Silwood2]